MKPAQVLLDTEFTSLDSPRLISLGMVSTSGREFYIELSDSWTIGECTLFVTGQVLPRLDNGRATRVLQERLGDLYEIIRWMTAETVDERRKLLATPGLKRALVGELSLAQKWEEDPGFSDLRADDVSRVGEALFGLNLQDLIKGVAARNKRVAGQELAAWLDAFGGPVLILADSPLDHQLTQDLLNTSGVFPRQIDYALLPQLIPGVNLAALRQVQGARESYFAAGGRRHHALDDARALACWLDMAESLNILHRG